MRTQDDSVQLRREFEKIEKQWRKEIKLLKEIYHSRCNNALPSDRADIDAKHKQKLQDAWDEKQQKIQEVVAIFYPKKPVGSKVYPVE